MKISDNTSISMPMKNLISIMAAVAVGVWAYFGVIERLTLIEMRNASLTKDLASKVGSGVKSTTKSATDGIKNLNPFKK